MFVSYAQNFEDIMLYRALKHVQSGFYIDIVAYDPVIHSVSLAFYERGWRGIHVEPNPHYAAALRKARPDDTVLNCLIANHRGDLPFFALDGLSTADEAIAAQHERSGHDVQRTHKPAMPLADVFQMAGDREIHWLKIDVEGLEAQVIQSWMPAPARPWIVVVESTRPNSQIECWHEWDPILRGYGYEYVYFDGLNRFYLSTDHLDLKIHFATGPNLFDHFILATKQNSPAQQVAHEALIAENNHLKQLLLIQNAEIASLNKNSHRKNIFMRLLFHSHGRPRRLLRRLMFHSDGHVRRMFRRFIFKTSGTPRRLFAGWLQQQSAAGSVSTPIVPMGISLPQANVRSIEYRTPIATSIDARKAMSLRCHDADLIPKVENAGQYMTEPDGTRVQIMHNGLKVLAGGYYGDWVCDLIEQSRGHHEPQEEAVFHEVMKHIPPQASMIELGGYWSFYSLWFLSQGANRRSLIVEADPNHLNVGKQNAALNTCAPEFIHAFVAGQPVAPVDFETESAGVIRLPGVSVPFLMDSRNIAHLDILHCDCQGVELAVLESCLNLFAAGRIDWVFVSTHSHHISHDPLTHQRCLALLQAAGATIVAEYDVHESFSGDGLIVARFGAMPANWEKPRLSYNRYSESYFRNPLYDLALAPATMTEKDVAAFLKSANPSSRNALFDAFCQVELSDYLYVERNNSRFIVNSHDKIISRSLFIHGEFDFDKFIKAMNLLKAEFPALGQAKFPFDVLMDVGANIGSICIPALAQGFAARAIAIEPHPVNAQLLHANVAINGLLEQMDIVQKAVGPQDNQTVEMALSLENWGDHRIVTDSATPDPGEDIRKRIEVQSMRLDTIEPQIRDKRFMIWMDIQGYEGHALIGATSLLAQKPPLVLEFWPNGMRRMGSFANLCDSVAHYRGFYDLDAQTPALRPITQLAQLFTELDIGEKFTDILVI